MSDDLRATILAQTRHTLGKTALEIPGATRYVGKVRDVYRTADELVIVTTDRVSAFDVVLGTVPFKGEVLNRTALFHFERTRDILPNHVSHSPDPNVLVARPCRPFPVEFVMRAYVTGSLWRDVQAGRHGAYGVPIPSGLRKDERLPEPILTPSTKAELGEHDAPTSREEILRSGAMTEAQWDAAETAAKRLFARGQALAAERGLILVDTKYELGLDAEDRLTLIDEVHTPDSSRYWRAEGYQARFEAGEEQHMLDKENLRSWLRDVHGYTGDGPPPPLGEDIIVKLCTRYFEAYRTLTGAPFVPTVGDVHARIEKNLSGRRSPAPGRGR